MSCGSPGHGVNQGDASKNFGFKIGEDRVLSVKIRFRSKPRGHISLS